MAGKILTRMGDGFLVEITEGELRKDLEEGTKDAAERAKVPPLSGDELKFCLIFTSHLPGLSV